jgi:hypothetical protein
MILAKNNVRLIAFYLPQFHPIRENNEWWGKGFTEWTNVAKAKPLFRGHQQPKIPADLGFYDLRVPETRFAQAEMASNHGIEGFAYWHYWFGNGRRLLERPFDEVLTSGVPDFPFCLAWANESWTGIWHGAPDRVLIEQHFPGDLDYQSHFYHILPALTDDRYILVGGKPLFIIFKPENLPNPKRFTDIWRELAEKAGLPGLHLVGTAVPGWEPSKYGFDAVTMRNPGIGRSLLFRDRSLLKNRLSLAITGTPFWKLRKAVLSQPLIVPYANYIRYALPISKFGENYPCVVPNWDNTPRSGKNGSVLLGSSPELFREHMEKAMEQVLPLPKDRQIVLLKSWNEWAEGNYLEPDLLYGKRYLQVIREFALA